MFVSVRLQRTSFFSLAIFCLGLSVEWTDELRENGESRGRLGATDVSRDTVRLRNINNLIIHLALIYQQCSDSLDKN